MNWTISIYNKIPLDGLCKPQKSELVLASDELEKLKLQLEAFWWSMQFKTVNYWLRNHNLF